MDTTPENIKMCEKATEIQALGPKKDQWGKWPEASAGQWIYDPIAEEVIVIGNVNTKDGVCDCCANETPDEFVWLSRQDELQEMVKCEQESYRSLLRRFYSWMIDIVDLAVLKMSLEQLWLAFVMKEKFSKAWDGEDWV